VVRSCAPNAHRWALGKPFTALIPSTTMSMRRMGHLCRLVREQPERYFPSWSHALTSSLEEAVGELRARHGDDTAAWRWGTVRPLVMEHAFAQQPPLDRVFNIGPIDGAGDNTTILQGGVDYATPVTKQGWVPLLRAAFDVGNWDACRFAMVGGQSGNPCSRHYEDQVGPWQTGEGIEISWTPSRIRDRAVAELTLLPKP
jgi:penicillin amidase